MMNKHSKFVMPLLCEKNNLISYFNKWGINENKTDDIIKKIDYMMFLIQNVDKNDLEVIRNEAIFSNIEIVMPSINNSKKFDIIIVGNLNNILSFINKLKDYSSRFLQIANEIDFCIRDQEKNNKSIIIAKKEIQIPAIMGIINCTSDSFSGDGLLKENNFVDSALIKAKEMIDAGASIIDVGGQSTYPGAIPINDKEEIERVVPVISAIHKEFDILISIDTYKTKVAKAAIEAGATIVNDIRALREKGMLELVADKQCPVILTHMRSYPLNMAKYSNYNNFLPEVFSFLNSRVDTALDAGIDKSNIIIDPGFGFSKTGRQNLALLHNIYTFLSLGFPVLIGASRKFIKGDVSTMPIEKWVGNSIALSIMSALYGASIIRTHDVEITRQALDIAQSIQAAGIE